MANFWDLPRTVRDDIYRLHLVQDEPITRDEHQKLATAIEPSTRSRPSRRMPAICFVSDKLDREAAPVYYGENHFSFGRLKYGNESPVWIFAYVTKPRHLRMIRKVTFGWPQPTGSYESLGGLARESFLTIARMTGLQELYIRVNEQLMVRSMLQSRRLEQWRTANRPISRQDNLAILRYPGMTGLLQISGVPHVQFIKEKYWNNAESGGPIPGGLLETDIASRLMAPKKQALHPKSQNGAFDFMSLPAELRNRIYNLVLEIDGPVHPSTKPPSSAPKKCSTNGSAPPLGSCLNLLAVNRQIHDEAAGIFYHANELEFFYPTQLHAFMLNLGQTRLRSISNVTVHYYNVKSGGVNLIDLTFPMLKQLTGLRRLHIIFPGTLYRRSADYRFFSVYGIGSCNPLQLAGIKSLFDLRGIADIELIDTDLGEYIEELKKKEEYPDGFGRGTKAAVAIKIVHILAHFNAALAAAQEGKLNKELLQDSEWHTHDVFPPVIRELEEIPEQEDGGEVVGEDLTEEVDDATNDATAMEGDESDDVTAVSSMRVGITRASLRSATKETIEPVVKDDPAEEEAEATEMSENDAATVDDDIDEEIVVKHVARSAARRSLAKLAIAPGGRVGGLDGASDELDDDESEDEEHSYADRESSVEL